MFVRRSLPTSTYITLDCQWGQTTMWARFREIMKIPFLLVRLIIIGNAHFGKFTMPVILDKGGPHGLS